MDSNQPCLILVVDDEKEFEEYIETLLQRRGYDHVSFVNSCQALDFVKNHREEVDIIISDIKMPGIDGIDLARKAADIKKDIAIILVSGYSDELAKSETIPNVKTVLDKPVRKADLLTAVETEIKSCRKRRGM